MHEKLIEVIRGSVGLLDDIVDVLKCVLSGASSREYNSDRKRTETVELTHSAKMNATFVMSEGYGLLPRGLHVSTYQLRSVA